MYKTFLDLEEHKWNLGKWGNCSGSFRLSWVSQSGLQKIMRNKNNRRQSLHNMLASSLKFNFIVFPCIIINWNKLHHCLLIWPKCKIMQMKHVDTNNYKEWLCYLVVSQEWCHSGVSSRHGRDYDFAGTASESQDIQCKDFWQVHNSVMKRVRWFLWLLYDTWLQLWFIFLQNDNCFAEFCRILFFLTGNKFLQLSVWNVKCICNSSQWKTFHIHVIIVTPSSFKVVA